ncbi:PIN domain-containing protein [candidate division CSSED10-310 bacterium]|uniref:PIN domain-containing protein n=1 Tax=candidate division CSSED10-310 bacterium TaxID=2855610 RepID=A0ABV6YT23_UNCC1
MNNYLVDTSIWIEFFKGTQIQIKDFITSRIDEDGIFYNDIILSELLIGALHEKEFNFLKLNFAGFKYLGLDKQVFQMTSEMGYQLRRNGKIIPLTDLIVASQCIVNQVKIVTLDKHFQIISQYFDLAVFQIQ